MAPATIRGKRIRKEIKTSSAGKTATIRGKRIRKEIKTRSAGKTSRALGLLPPATIRKTYTNQANAQARRVSASQGFRV